MNQPAAPFRSRRSGPPRTPMHVTHGERVDGGQLRIGQLAALSGVSVRALRYYEARQLLESSRSSGGQRRYPPAAVERVREIQRLMEAGLSSTTIVEVLPCIQARTPVPLRALLARLESERSRLDQQVSELTQARRSLQEVITAIAALPALGEDPAAAPSGTP